MDTNIHLRLNEAGSPLQPVALNALERLEQSGCRLCIAPQNVIEFWCIAMKPSGAPSNGLGLSLSDTEAVVSTMKSQFDLLTETPPIFAEWERIVKAAQVSGVKVHDAKLAAIMAVNSIPNILTFNVRDFKRFEPIAGITVVDPANI